MSKAEIGHNSGTSGERLKSFIARIERVETEIASLQEDRKEIYAEAKGTGFDAKTIRIIVRERKISEHERRERDALLDLYKAAIGMLDGTPLGSAAIDRLKKTEQESDDKDVADTEPQQPEKPTEKDVDAARKAGGVAATKGKSVTTNPYPAHDPCRAAWDEGWCAFSGSDGMDIPDAWKPEKKTKKEEGES